MVRKAPLARWGRTRYVGKLNNLFPITKEETKAAQEGQQKIMNELMDGV